MICPTCRNSGRPGYVLIETMPIAPGIAVRHLAVVPCPDCHGGIASCCDAAGSAQPDDPRKDSE